MNNYGDVDALLIEASSLSSMLQEDLRDRFHAAGFTPGRFDGKSVKALLRITIALD